MRGEMSTVPSALTSVLLKGLLFRFAWRSKALCVFGHEVMLFCRSAEVNVPIAGVIPLFNRTFGNRQVRNRQV
jgi:hypothetical protein